MYTQKVSENSGSESVTIDYVRDKVKFNREHVSTDSRLYYHLCAHDYYSVLESELEQQFTHQNRVNAASILKHKNNTDNNPDNSGLHLGGPPPPPPLPSNVNVGAQVEMLQLLRLHPTHSELEHHARLQFRQRQLEQRRRENDRDRASGV